MQTIQQNLQWGTETLKTLPDARHEAMILLAAVLHCDKAYLMTWPEKMLESAQQKAYEALITRRQAGEPVAYILGKKAFWDWDVIVTPDTLIPRPETELLIEQVLAVLPQTACNVVDIGTGSGIIACTLAKERPLWQILATDCSQAALSVAQENAQNLQCTNVTLQKSDWCDDLKLNNYDAIISNPPYIPENDPHPQQGDCRFEPASALIGGKTGLEAFQHLIPQAKQHLKPGGWIFFEHGFDQSSALQNILKNHGYTDIKTVSDLAGKPRVTLGQMRK